MTSNKASQTSASAMRKYVSRVCCMAQYNAACFLKCFFIRTLDSHAQIARSTKLRVSKSSGVQPIIPKQG
jgi:hypothetical protein